METVFGEIMGGLSDRVANGNSIIGKMIGRISKNAAEGDLPLIAVGLGHDIEHNGMIIEAARTVVEYFGCVVIAICDKPECIPQDTDICRFRGGLDFDNPRTLLGEIGRDRAGIYAISVKDPVGYAVALPFISDKTAAVRGSLSSSLFLPALRKIAGKYGFGGSFIRIALLETSSGVEFFYAPVGIDECNSIGGKTDAVNNFIKIAELLDIKPKVAVLAGGRADDRGRCLAVDKTIDEAQKLVEIFSETGFVHSYNILIENAVADGCNFILAPDGISGNLIYRTLVHLGSGRAYGAIYSSVFLGVRTVFVDCSRVAAPPELLGSFITALFGIYSLQ